ncbi:hypothetical protein As57867_001892, partial [Aphanomyces stellatus]
MDALLDEILHLRHRAPSCRQDVAVIRHCLDAVRSFVDQHDEFKTMLDGDRDAVVLNLLDFDPDACQWFPEYGCVILATKAKARLQCTHLVLVYPDQWQAQVSRRPAGATVVASPQSVSSLDLGLVPTTSVSSVLAKLNALLCKVQHRRGSDRSAVNGQGNQKTPHFIHALACQTLRTMDTDADEDQDEVQSQIAPYGGSTDVGLHTGGQPRATSWPLVDAALSHLMAHRSNKYCQFRVHFQLWLLETWVCKMTPNAIDTLMGLMDAVVLGSLDLEVHGHNIAEIANRVEAVRHRWNNAYDLFMKQEASKYILTYVETKLQEPDIVSAWPIHVTLTQAPATMDEIQRRARENSGALPCFHWDHANSSSATKFQLALDWMKSDERLKTPTSQEAHLLVLNTVNQLMWACATHLCPVLPKDLVAPAPLRLLDADVASLDLLVSEYSNRMQLWLDSDHGKQSMMVKRRSQEVLVTWIAFCLVHQQCGENHKLVLTFATALKWQDLSHLVLDDKRAMDAALVVAGYIRRMNQVSPKKLFCLADVAGTIEFSRSFAATDASMMARWKQEKDVIEERKREYMRQVEYKKKRAAELREEYNKLNRDEDTAQVNLTQAKTAETKSWSTYNRGNRASQYGTAWREWQDCKTMTQQALEELKSTQNLKRSKYSDLENMLRAPKFVTCPLPETQDKTLSVVFFFQIPSTLSTLSRLAASAQYTLVPRPPGNLSRLNEDNMPRSWANHYNANSMSGLRAEHSHWVLYPRGLQVPPSYGPATVDLIWSANQKFWFPTDYAHGAVWSTETVPLPGLNPHLCMNPFSTTRESVSTFFTHQFSAPDDPLQWAIQSPAVAEVSESRRGNLAYANLFMKPTAFTKNGFLAFGSMRSFPNQQLRKLIDAVHTRTLPLDQVCVVQLIRQTMCQLGSLSDTPVPTLLWKRDLDIDGFVAWNRALTGLIDLLGNTPRQFKEFIAIVEMTAYLSQYQPVAQSLARNLANIAIRWVKDVDDQSKAPAVSATDGLEFRAKECLLYGYAIVAYAGVRQLTADDATRMTKLIVSFQNGTQFGCGSCVELDLAAIKVNVNHVMTSKLDELMALLVANRPALTAAVQSIIQDIPTTAEWIRMDKTACFESIVNVNSNDEHFLINVLTGTVLWNGVPLERLPLSVLEHPMYASYFGDQDFDVKRQQSSNGDIVYRTAMPHYGDYYEFALLNQSGGVRIQAMDAKTNRILELVAFTDATWLLGLPVRLLKMHSHWVDFESNTMVLRARAFTNRSIAYIATLEPHCRCIEIPLSNQCNKLTELEQSLTSWLYFVDQSECLGLVTALTKFEDAAYIHTLVNPKDGTLRINLTRFGLAFRCEAANGQLTSLNYNKYHLASSQQLDFTLPFFQHYLVLERSLPSPGHPGRILLVPQGTVIVVDGFARIETSIAFDAQLPVWAYSFASHSNQLSATCIAARLQLSAIFAASSTCLPDPHLKMTGSEAAVNLVRQCWISRPFTEDETTKLEVVVQFAHKEPALAIVCDQIAVASENRAFLYGHEPAPVDVPAYELVMTSTTELRAWMMASKPWNSYRRGLTSTELNEVFAPHPGPRLHDPPTGNNAIVTLPPPPIASNFVDEVEKELLLLAHASHDSASAQPFPLPSMDRTEMGKELAVPLKASWDQFQALPTLSLKFSSKRIFADHMKTIQGEVDRAYKVVETYLRETIEESLTPPTLVSQLKLLRACNRRPIVSLHDWLVMAVDIDSILRFNSFFSEVAAKEYQQVTRLWLAIGVLKGRVGRILHLVDVEESDAIIIRELQTERTWRVDTYPHWLVFEVEGSLQIRPEQTTIALHLLNEPSGTLCQLNMGLGKTRVILPMLVLQYVAQGEIPRVHLLSSILHEALDFLHLYLTASTLGIRLVEQPFHR